jgi:histidinol dehydrogenase
MQVINFPPKKTWAALLSRPAIDTKDLEATVEKILKDVKENGDEAVRRYSLMFDKAALTDLAVAERALINADQQVDGELKNAILQAKKNIELFHVGQLQTEQVIETMPGVSCWRKTVQIEKVGLYIPGGTAPLFSTLLMLAVPAQIAGCKEIILCSPPDTKGNLHPALLYTAHVLGITKVFRVGGVQAIAAMSYGTESIPAVYKIFGPGNQYVTCAKQLVQKDGVAIDMPAGPSELAVYADDSANAAFVAADLLSQAEHGVDSQVILVTCSTGLSDRVILQIQKQIETLPRKDIAKRALENSKAIIVGTEEEAMELLNTYAPEHLLLACVDADGIAEKVINAGSVFLGHFSPESAGDYASGTNHTLPTNGHARAYGGVSVDSFVKKISFQRLSEQGLSAIGKTIEVMAEAEGLHAHARAVRIRLEAGI